jgi:hypothetical protein
VLHQETRAFQLRAVAATVVVFACAASAGIHAGIVPEHLREEPRLGVAFILAVLVLLATGTAVAARPTAGPVAWIAALVLGGLIVGYVASRATGIPVLAPDPEAIDGIGAVAVGIELLGVAGALVLAHPIRRRARRPVLDEVTP